MLLRDFCAFLRFLVAFLRFLVAFLRFLVALWLLSNRVLVDVNTCKSIYIPLIPLSGGHAQPLLLCRGCWFTPINICSVTTHYLLAAAWKLTCPSEAL